MTDNPYWQNHNHRRLDPEDVLLIRQLHDEGLTQIEIGEKFEVSKSHISKIVTRKVWRHLVDEIDEGLDALKEKNT